MDAPLTEEPHDAECEPDLDARLPNGQNIRATRNLLGVGILCLSVLFGWAPVVTSQDGEDYESELN